MATGHAHEAAPFPSLAIADRRGLACQSRIRAILTLSVLGPLFRPLLFSATDHVQYAFVDVLGDCAVDLDRLIPDKRFRMPWLLWFVLTPRAFFESIFLPDATGQRLMRQAIFADAKDPATVGRHCAYLTQGYALWHLSQLLSNSSPFRETTRWTPYVLDLLVDGLKSSSYVQYAYEHYRGKFGPSGSITDPRRWAHTYVHDVAWLVTKDEARAAQLVEADTDAWTASQLAAFNLAFFARRRDEASAMASAIPPEARAQSSPDTQ